MESPEEDTAWNDIVAAADKKFPADRAKRAVYLVMALKAGDPADRIRQLKLGDSEGGGSSGSGDVHFEVVKLADQPVRTQLQYYVDDRTHTLTARPFGGREQRADQRQPLRPAL